MSALYWLKLNYKSIGFILLCVILGGFYGWHDYTVGKLEKDVLEWRTEAQSAQAQLAVAKREKESLEQALEEQQKATVVALSKRTVIYRAVQKEVAKNESARDWYNSPVPAGITGLLRENGTGND